MAQVAVPIHTYHCICSTLVLATPYALESLPTRASQSQDQAIVLPLPDESGAKWLPSTLHNLTGERKPMIVRREDGFEKRLMLKCERCNLHLAYQLVGKDEDTTASLIFLLPGGLVKTEEMKAGK